MTVLIFLNSMMKTFIVAFARNYTVKMWRIGLNAVASVVCIAILEMLHAALLVLVKAGHMKLVQIVITYHVFYERLSQVFVLHRVPNKIDENGQRNKLCGSKQFVKKGSPDGPDYHPRFTRLQIKNG